MPKSLVFLSFLLVGCVSPTDPKIRSIKDDLHRMQSTDVLLVSDHTLPQHLNLSTAGANDEERRFIDPTLVRLNEKLEARGLKTHTLNVEDMTIDGDINNKEVFDAAYAQYDDVLRAAAKAGVTIVSIHYDADLIPAEEGKDGVSLSPEEDGKKYDYIG
ncbi:MAG: hypothetical protein AAF438_18035, partial [Pseudomonadota bacterium]